VASGEPFFPKPGWLGAFKLRAAYGSSGLHPGPTDALQFFNPTPVVINNADVPGITIGSLGNAALKPERTNETEAGFDAEFRPLSAQIGFAPGSYFQRPYTFNDANNDGIIATSEVTLAPSATFQGQPFPDHGGSVSTTITVFQRVHLYGLVDGRFRNKLFNRTEQFRC